MKNDNFFRSQEKKETENEKWKSKMAWWGEEAAAEIRHTIELENIFL